MITGAALDAPAEVIAVWAAVVHPGYDPLAEPEVQHDLAVLVLATAPQVTPASWAETLPAELVVGAPLTASGYGAIAATPGASSGRRLAAASQVDELTAAAMWTTGGTACGGDSGGAVFLDTAGGERLVGVIKGSAPACTDRGLAVRTDVEAAFVDGALATAAATLDPMRPPVAADGCAETCATHADCALGMLCLPEGETRHCGWRDVRVGVIGEACADDEATCIAVGQGAARECRRFTACAADTPEDPGDGGCCNAGGAGDPVAGILLALVAAWRLRHAGRGPARVSSSRA